MTYLIRGPVSLKFKKPPPETTAINEIKFYSKPEETIKFIGPSPESDTEEAYSSTQDSNTENQALPVGLIYSISRYDDESREKTLASPEYYTVKENHTDKNYRKYINSYVTGVWDAPNMQPKPSNANNGKELSNIRKGTQMSKLIEDSYFGDQIHDSTPNQHWQELGNELLIELENISEKLGTTQEPVPTAEDPYAFDFYPPGEMWAPVKSSVTYTTGK